MLAIERARQLADDGLEVLLLCFNAPLGAHLEQQVADAEGITAGGFHKFALGVVADAGMLPEGEFDRVWWDDELPVLLPEAAEALGRSFDAVIIDEGQDFHTNWFTALQLVLKDPDTGVMYVFADSQQDLYRTGWEPPFEGAPYTLDTNCRNTAQIARRVADVFGTAEATRGVDGPEPGFTPINSPAQVPKALGQLVVRLLDKENMAARDLVILSTMKRLVEGLRGQELAGVTFVEAGGKGVVVETVHRFKGLEADAVILVLDDIASTEDRALAYVGMSRARVFLQVLGPPSAAQALNWTD